MTNLLAQLNFLTKLFSNLYVADFFDVLIIAILIYFIIFLFKQTRSFYVAAGFGIIIALYPIAQTFGLYLTSMVFQAFWSVFFIALVIIFQEELRRFFEQLAIWSTRQIKRGKEVTQPAVIKEILDSIKKMAMDSVGALVVIAGHDPLTKYVNGGRILDGVISEELLLSIFDPTSMGHDGALIIKGNRIALFGGHLPLSRDFAQIGKRGTRHSAALGLSEVTDAFVIVVSEERGEVSYVYKGKLTTLINPDDIIKPLTHFIAGTFPKQSYTTTENLLKHNSPEKIVSLTFAIIFWFFFSFQATTTQRDFKIPVTYKNINDDAIIETTKPDTATVTLEARGSHSFELLDIQGLSIAIDAADLKTGTQKVQVTEDKVVKPANFSIVNIKPQEIDVTLKSVKSIKMTIVPNIIKDLTLGYVITNVTVLPSVVDVLVPDTYNGTYTLTTSPIYVSGSLSTSIEAKILIPAVARLKNSSDNVVEVNIEIQKK
ncbi:MAG: diadenylate cyclase [bacterium]|nr:diadenylate cyclase [bacterium]